MSAWRFGSAILAVSMAAQAPTQPAVDQSLVPYASTADSARLPDGRVLHLVCMGRGAPTVIFTAGQGGWSGAWSHVQPAVAKLTRTCAWDRPGYGLSDGVSAKPSVATTTNDLAAALTAKGISGPYVLVGHSMGSYETLLFADRRSRDVAGMVLVDPSLPDQLGRAQRVMDRIGFRAPASPAGSPPPRDMWRECAEEVRAGRLKPNGPDPKGCLAFLPPVLPAGVRSAVAAKVTSDPRQFETISSFQATSLQEGAKIVINPSRNYGEMPLVVLTATAWPRGAPEDQRAFVEASMADSDRGHDELAALSARGVNIRVPGAGHDIQDERPQVVIDAIVRMVRQVRGEAAHR